jgi:hypothetical protein
MPVNTGPPPAWFSVYNVWMLTVETEAVHAWRR